MKQSDQKKHNHCECEDHKIEGKEGSTCCADESLNPHNHDGCCGGDAEECCCRDD